MRSLLIVARESLSSRNDFHLKQHTSGFQYIPQYLAQQQHNFQNTKFYLELSTPNNKVKSLLCLPPQPSVREYSGSGPASFSVLCAGGRYWVTSSPPPRSPYKTGSPVLAHSTAHTPAMSVIVCPVMSPSQSLPMSVILLFPAICNLHKPCPQSICCFHSHAHPQKRNFTNMSSFSNS